MSKIRHKRMEIEGCKCLNMHLILPQVTIHVLNLVKVPLQLCALTLKKCIYPLVLETAVQIMQIVEWLGTL